ncbi:hypothetical protein PYV02_08630 [Leifsonia sp. H3M29-4]|uniref:hypothetical protein n=1 Tax=Salinibacterium metalliresistens TaxID=3031321 RepID=UPI0023D9ED40|nr:hypothetical protein [Salinibacterium metalliresistens]MDF1479145.1 hypothetical protein [Salinibacterium metalliresistens]
MTGSRPVLLITPSFFGYERDIALALERRGLGVDMIDERPSNSALMKALLRVRSSALGRATDRYYRRFVDQGYTRGRRLVIVIKGEVVPAWFLDAVRRDSPGAVFVFYTFDSLANSANFVSLLPVFDHLFSFQAETGEVGSRFRLKHLFYGPEFSPLGDADTRRYGIAFVGTVHSDRYRFVKRIVAAFGSSFVYFYVQARWYFRVRRLTSARYREIPEKDVRFDKLSRSAVAEVFRNSLAVLDMQHEQQTGLTMRTFEVIASGAYLVTTNAFVALTPLADTGRVIVVPPLPTEHDIRELTERLAELPVPTSAPEGFAQFSVDAWVDEFVMLMPGEVPT